MVTITNRKLYENGVEVAYDANNPEHVKAMLEKQKWLDALPAECVEFEFDKSLCPSWKKHEFDIDVEFECLKCGCSVTKSIDTVDVMDLLDLDDEYNDDGEIIDDEDDFNAAFEDYNTDEYDRYNLKNKEIKCKCGQKYQFIYNDEDDIVLKLKN
jgi:hypothetical protein